MPVKRRKLTCPSDRPTSRRRPLTTTNNIIDDQAQIVSTLIEIFNNSQHVTSSDQALTQLKKLYNTSNFAKFEKPFMDCLKRLFQSKQTIYFKTSCDFLCKFLQHVTNLQDDRLVRSCIDVADHYMQIVHEDCRLNALLFVSKFLSHIESLDEEICKALLITLPKRIRDKKGPVRAQAVLASRKFQNNKLIQEAFRHHFDKDPEQTVRKALVLSMEIDTFGLDFLVESTQDSHESIRKVAFQRIGKVSPNDWNLQQLHRILHNGLFERDRQASLSFKTNTLEPWLSKLYDGLDLVKLLESFDLVNNQEDIDKLLLYIHERDLEKIENNGTATRLHHVVESFRDRLLNSNNKCLPQLSETNERTITIWLSMVKFCKKNQSSIKPVKVRTVPATVGDPNISIEKILDSQEQNDEVAELYERLTPDLINLVDFVKRFVRYTDQVIKENDSEIGRYEFVYHKLMEFTLTYEIGDEAERKKVQEDLGSILRENLLTEKFTNFIPPIIKCLYKLVYSSSTNLMINYISELINNVRSHLEDLVAPSQHMGAHSTIGVPSSTPRSVKKVTIAKQLPTRSSLIPRDCEQDLEYKMATIKLDLEELQDKLDDCIKTRNFEMAKMVQDKIDDRKTELNLLHGRRCSIASDVSHMSLIIDNDPDNNKLSSTMLGPDTNMDDSRTSFDGKDEVKVFKHHTNELIKCLQMYQACLQNVKVNEVPQTMLNHLNFLTYECLDDWFKNDTRVRSLMVACNGLAALQDSSFAKLDRTKTLLIAACYDNGSLELRTVAFKSLVDIMIEHEDLQISMDKFEKFLDSALRDYGRYDPKKIKPHELEYITTIIQGAAKLFYYKKLASPEVLSHMILWWYHPRTYSKLTQFIGVFLPQLVRDLSAKRTSDDDDWLENLLSQTHVTSIEYLHGYILGAGQNIMCETDMVSLISFLSTLVPISIHPRVANLIDQRIDDLPSSVPSNADLIKYLKQARNSLASSPQPKRRSTPENAEGQDMLASPL